LDLAEGEELSRIRVLGWMVEKCLEEPLDLPPNLLYAKVGLGIALQVNYVQRQLVKP
jgi:hypothetical protein